MAEVVAARKLGHKLQTMSCGLYGGGAPFDVKAKALAKVAYWTKHPHFTFAIAPAGR